MSPSFLSLTHGVTISSLYDMLSMRLSFYFSCSTEAVWKVFSLVLKSLMKATVWSMVLKPFYTCWYISLWFKVVIPMDQAKS